jgi:hypothetical protein
VHGNEETDRVDTVTDTTEREGKTNTQAVDEGASEETDNGKGTVESSVL